MARITAIVAPMLRAPAAQLCMTAAGAGIEVLAAAAAAALARWLAAAAFAVAAAVAAAPALAAPAAALLRGTRPSGNGSRDSASTAWAVTHTGVCAELRE